MEQAFVLVLLTHRDALYGSGVQLLMASTVKKLHSQEQRCHLVSHCVLTTNHTHTHTHLEGVDAGADVVVRLLTQTHQSSRVCFQALPHGNLQNTRFSTHGNMRQRVRLRALTSDSLCVRRDGWVCGKVRRKACCRSGLRAGV